MLMIFRFPRSQQPRRHMYVCQSGESRYKDMCTHTHTHNNLTQFRYGRIYILGASAHLRLSLWLHAFISFSQSLWRGVLLNFASSIYVWCCICFFFLLLVLFYKHYVHISRLSSFAAFFLRSLFSSFTSICTLYLLNFFFTFCVLERWLFF